MSKEPEPLEYLFAKLARDPETTLTAQERLELRRVFPRMSDERLFRVSANRGLCYSNLGSDWRTVQRLSEVGELAGVPIDRTPGGRILGTLYRRYGGDVSTFFAREASITYTRQLSGHVTVYCIGAKRSKVFREQEIPTLLANENVTHINGIAREQLFELYRTSDELCYGAIERASKPLIEQMRSVERELAQLTIEHHQHRGPEQSM